MGQLIGMGFLAACVMVWVSVANGRRPKQQQQDPTEAAALREVVRQQLAEQMKD